MSQQVHPFPARMAPELALKSLEGLKPDSVIVDPMMGSGTVLRHAASLGHRAFGYDMDPLAVLMSRVSVTKVDDEEIASLAATTIELALNLKADDIALPWIDEDPETERFISYWFGETQRVALRRISFALQAIDTANQPAADVLRVALSRIIVTKEQMASLARDTSHSRPHKVAETSDYDVLAGFERSVSMVRKRLLATPPMAGAEVSLGDARNLSNVQDSSVDMVLTSPPYLNAIDYMRGHRLSLVWLGHRFSELRSVRSTSIGAERRSDDSQQADWVEALMEATGAVHELPPRYRHMIERYVRDLRAMMTEVSRILKSNGRATFVMGNSCLKGVFVRNSAALSAAAQQCGLSLVGEYERPLPERSRYLPMTAKGALGARMRTETILTFAHA